MRVTAEFPKHLRPKLKELEERDRVIVICRKCKEPQPRAAYAISRKADNGLQNWCKRCSSEYQKTRTTSARARGRVQMSLYLRLELHEWIKQEAMAQGVSMNKYLECVMEAHQMMRGGAKVTVERDAGARVLASPAGTGVALKEDAPLRQSSPGQHRKWARPAGGGEKSRRVL